MLIELLIFSKMPVGALEEAEMVGKIHRLAIDPKEQKLIGFTVKTGGYFSKTHSVSMTDVVDVDKNGVVINSRQSLLPNDEIVRMNEILKKKFSIIGLKVITKSGEKIGRVEDAVIDTNSGDILRIYTSSFAKRRIFERSQIEKMTFLEVVVKKNMQEARTSLAKTVSAVENEMA